MKVSGVVVQYVRCLRVHFPGRTGTWWSSRRRVTSWGQEHPYILKWKVLQELEVPGLSIGEFVDRFDGFRTFTPWILGGIVVGELVEVDPINSSVIYW